MKKIMLALLIAFFIAAFGSAAFAIHELIPSETQIPEPGPDAEKLNAYIVKYKPYTSWHTIPGKSRLYKGSQPHGALITTFVNETAYFSILKRTGLEDGAIIAQENYTADKKFDSLYVMYKIKGYNQSAGDWFWVKYGPDGQALVSGKVDTCIHCHESQRKNDYIFTRPVKR